MRKLLALAVCSVVALAACGGGSGGGGGELSDEEQDFVDAAMADFDAEEAAPLTRDDAECLAGSFVSELGVDRLEELDITPEDFSNDDFPSGMTEDEAKQVVAGFDDCVSLSDLFLEAMAEDAELSAEAKQCLADAFDEKTVREIFTTMLARGEDALENDPDLMSRMLQIFSKCPEALTAG